MLQGATDLPLLYVVNGHISIRQPLAGRPWPPLNPAIGAVCAVRHWVSAGPIDVAAVLHRRFHNELRLRGWSHQALLTALEKTMSGLSYRVPPYACYLRMVVANGGASWHSLDDPWTASPDLYAGWCARLMHWPMVRFDVSPEFFSAGELHVANICFTPQPQFWNLAWPYDQRGAQHRVCVCRLHSGFPAQDACNVCFFTVQPAVRSGCHISWARLIYARTQQQESWYSGLPVIFTPVLPCV